jgi:hypothetical protein
VAKITSDNTGPKTYPDELREILERANRGDDAALPQLRQALDAHPELVAEFGDLVKHAEDSVLRWASGNCLTAREAIRRQVASLRRRLKATAASDLEKLLVDRVVVTWLQVYTADVHVAERMAQGVATPAAQAAQKALDRAHQRHLSAIRTLATVRKLARPALPPVQVAARMQARDRRAVARRSSPVHSGAAIEN